MLNHMAQRRIASPLAWGVVLAAAISATAQTPARAEPEVQQQDAPATFRSRSEMVLVPVIVRDS